MICKNCGSEIPDNSAFCPKCRKKVSADSNTLNQNYTNSYANAPVQDTAKENKKYNVLTIVLLVLFFPAGLYVMWKKSSWSKEAKIAVSIAFGFYVFLWMLSAVFGGHSTVSNKAVTTTKPTSSAYYMVTRATTETTTERTTVSTTAETTTEKNSTTARAETTTKEHTTAQENQSKNQTFIVNKNTGKFHYPNCQHVARMKDENKKEIKASSVEEMEKKGYTACETCIK